MPRFASSFRDRVGPAVKPAAVSVNSITKQIAIGSESGLSILGSSENSSQRICSRLSREFVTATSYLDAGILAGATKGGKVTIFDACDPSVCESVTDFPAAVQGSVTCMESSSSLASVIVGSDTGSLAVIDIRQPSMATRFSVEGALTCLRVLSDNRLVIASSRGVQLRDMRLMNAPVVRFGEVTSDQLETYQRTVGSRPPSQPRAKRPRPAEDSRIFIEDAAFQSLPYKPFGKQHQVATIVPYSASRDTLGLFQSFPATLEVYSVHSGRLLDQIFLRNTTTCISDAVPLPSRYTGGRQSVLCGNSDGSISIYDLRTRTDTYAQSAGAHVGGLACIKALGNWGCVTVGTDGMAVVQRWQD